MVQYTLSSTTPLPHGSLFSKKGVNKYIHCETYLQQWVFIDEWEGKELKDVLGKRTRKKTWRVIGTLFWAAVLIMMMTMMMGMMRRPLSIKILTFILHVNVKQQCDGKHTKAFIKFLIFSSTFLYHELVCRLLTFHKVKCNKSAFMFLVDK